jgi:TonB family protein
MKNFYILKLTSFLIVLLPLLGMAQGKGSKKIMNTDSVGYNEEFYVMKKTPTVKHGEYRKQTKKGGIAFEKGFYKNGKRDGKWIIKMKGNSRVYSTGSYKAGKKIGQWTYYYDSKVDQIYDHTANKVITSKREKGKLDYIGGRTLIRIFIEEILVYNESAKKRGIRGKVYLTFKVNDKKEVHTINITKGVHDLLDVEALRVVELIPPNWILPLKAGFPTGGDFSWEINFGSK